METFRKALHWKLRRIAAGLRQQDVAREIGLSTTRYSGIERGDVIPSESEQRLIEKQLPSLAISFEQSMRRGHS